MTDPVAAFAAQFDALRPSLPGARRAPVDRRRAEGIDRFRRAGLPTRKQEAWRWTDLRRLTKLDFAAAPAEQGRADAFGAELAGDGPLMAFVNGVFRPELSRLDGLPAGVRLESLAALLEAGDPRVEQRFAVTTETPSAFAELNRALTRDGVVLDLAPGTVVETPIRLVFLTDPGDETIAVHPRLLVLGGANSQATLVELHRGSDAAPYVVNLAAEIELGDGARLRHVRRQGEGAQAIHLADITVTLGRDATYDAFTLSLGAELARTETRALFTGRGGDCRLNGAYLVDGARHVDTTTFVDHAVPDCRSREVFKGVLDDKGRGVFQGKILVRRDAQRTDGHQLHRALMLSRGAEVDAKPELEIYADDVKCSHGATVGEIDADALFYLRARGIGEAEARALLVEAFVTEALDEIADEALRAEFAAEVGAWLAARRKDARWTR